MEGERRRRRDGNENQRRQKNRACVGTRAAEPQRAGNRRRDVYGKEVNRPDKEPERRVEQLKKNSCLRLRPRLGIEIKRRHGETPQRETEREPLRARSTATIRGRCAASGSARNRAWRASGARNTRAPCRPRTRRGSPHSR